VQVLIWSWKKKIEQETHSTTYQNLCLSII
jgi:hypothetical protein